MKAKSAGYFVTGTDTEIGKTYSSVSLIKHLTESGYRVAALKPVASGCELTNNGLRNSDALLLNGAANVTLPYERVNRYAFEPAIAPHIAADLTDTQINLNKIVGDLQVAQSQADLVVVEAAGGWLVPLDDSQSIADLAHALALPVVVVVGIRLGCINHALLTLKDIQRSGVEIAGWVANRVDPDTEHADQQISSIRSRTSIPCIGEIPHSQTPGLKAKWAIEC